MLPIESFPLPERAIKLLKAAGFNFLNDFENCPEKSISQLFGFGPTYMSELKVFLKGRKIKLQKEKKEKGPKYDTRARDLVKLMLPKGEINFAIETKAAGQLLEHFAFEDIARVKLPPHVTSLRWLCSGIGGWTNRFIAELAPMRLVEEEKIEEKPVEIEEEKVEIEYKKAERPLDLQSFLGMRK